MGRLDLSSPHETRSESARNLESVQTCTVIRYLILLACFVLVTIPAEAAPLSSSDDQLEVPLDRLPTHERIQGVNVYTRTLYGLRKQIGPLNLQYNELASDFVPVSTADWSVMSYQFERGQTVIFPIVLNQSEVIIGVHRLALTASVAGQSPVMPPYTVQVVKKDSRFVFLTTSASQPIIVDLPEGDSAGSGTPPKYYLHDTTLGVSYELAPCSGNNTACLRPKKAEFEDGFDVNFSWAPPGDGSTSPAGLLQQLQLIKSGTLLEEAQFIWDASFPPRLVETRGLAGTNRQQLPWRRSEWAYSLPRGLKPNLTAIAFGMASGRPLTPTTIPEGLSFSHFAETFRSQRLLKELKNWAGKSIERYTIGTQAMPSGSRIVYREVFRDALSVGTALTYLPESSSGRVVRATSPLFTGHVSTLTLDPGLGITIRHDLSSCPLGPIYRLTVHQGAGPLDGLPREVVERRVCSTPVTTTYEYDRDGALVRETTSGTSLGQNVRKTRKFRTIPITNREQILSLRYWDVEDSVGNVLRYVHNIDGELKEIRNQSDGTTKRFAYSYYDSAKRHLKSIIETQPNGRKDELLFATSGNLTKSTLAKGTSQAVTLNYSNYDSTGRLTRFNDERGNLVTNSFNTNGKLHRVTVSPDSNPNPTTFRQFEYGYSAAFPDVITSLTEREGIAGSALEKRQTWQYHQSFPAVTKSYRSGTGISPILIEDNTYDLSSGRLTLACSYAGQAACTNFEYFTTGVNAGALKSVQHFGGIQSGGFLETVLFNQYGEPVGTRNQDSYNSHDTRYERDAFGRRVREVTNQGRGALETIREHRLDSEDRLVATKHSVGGILVSNLSLSYDGNSRSARIRQINDAVTGQIEKFRYDDPAKRKTRYEKWSADGVRDILVNSSSYDLFDRPLISSILSPQAGLIHKLFQFDKSGLVTATSDARGNPVLATRDYLGRIIRLDNSLQKRSYTRAIVGQTLITTEDYSNNSGDVDIRFNNSFAQDAVGRVVAASNPAQGLNVIHYYNNRGWNHRSEYSPSASGQPIEVVEALHDAQGRVTEMRRDATVVGRTEYSGLGRVVASTDSRNNTTQRRYDDLGRTILHVDPSGNSTSISYDLRATNAPNAVKLVKVANSGNGTGVEQAFDTLGSIVSQNSWGGGYPPFRREWTRTGNRLLAVRAFNESNQEVASTLYNYDSTGRVQSEVVSSGDGKERRTLAMQYEWDSFGSIAGMTYPDDGATSVRYERDSFGRTIRVYSNDAELLSLGYAGEYLRTLAFQDGVARNFTYDRNSGRLQESHDVDQSGATLLRQSFGYDEKGRLISRNEVGARTGFSGFSEQFSFNGTEHLESYGYSCNQNPPYFVCPLITTHSETLAGSYGATFDALGAVDAMYRMPTKFEYDLQGNPLASIPFDMSYTWSPQGVAQIFKNSSSSGALISHDGIGRTMRITSISPEQSTDNVHFRWNGMVLFQDERSLE